MVLVALCGMAQASVVVSLTEDSGGVAATASGTLDLTGLSSWGPDSRSPGLNAGSSYISLGVGGAETRYFTLSGPPNAWGDAGAPSATTASGDRFTLVAMMGYFATSTSYVSGSELYSTATWAGSTFADFGLTQATYTYTFGSGAHADSITVNVIPEPATFLLFGFGGLGAWMLRRNKLKSNVELDD